MTLGDLISEGAFTVVSGLNEKCLLKCYKSSLLADVRNTMKFTMLSDLFNVSIAENSLHVYLNDWLYLIKAISIAFKFYMFAMFIIKTVDSVKSFEQDNKKKFKRCSFETKINKF